MPKFPRLAACAKLWCLRWVMTITSEAGMACARWTDRCQAAIDRLEVERG
ncbi:MAG: hypothetical protein AB7D39_20770 [Pseudodesulfovibrio sp.]